jgi:hypothetical protein
MEWRETTGSDFVCDPYVTQFDNFISSIPPIDALCPLYFQSLLMLQGMVVALGLEVRDGRLPWSFIALLALAEGSIMLGKQRLFACFEQDSVPGKQQVLITIFQLLSYLTYRFIP